MQKRKKRAVPSSVAMRTSDQGDPGEAALEAVNHPAHYGGDSTYEAIKVIEAWGLGFRLGNAVKYICRAGRKNADALEDLKKAQWYLDREIAAQSCLTSK